MIYQIKTRQNLRIQTKDSKWDKNLGEDRVSKGDKPASVPLRKEI